jgi:hypothetical protein
VTNTFFSHFAWRPDSTPAAGVEPRSPFTNPFLLQEDPDDDVDEDDEFGDDEEGEDEDGEDDDEDPDTETWQVSSFRERP